MGFNKKTAKGRLDKYYHLAKDQGYRARSAFKLVHLNKKYGFLENAKVAVDLCAAPGGWLQVASQLMPKSHVLVGVDLVPIKPIPGVVTIVGDITTEKCRADLRKELKDWKADVVLHDGAPNVGKAWIQDAYSQAELVLSAFKLACELLVPGGIFVTKVFRSKEYNALMWVFGQLFEKVEATKPASSRSVSAEIFVICKGFKAPTSIDRRFFEPKSVFSEDATKTLVTSQAALLSGVKNRKRFRDGYEDDATILYKECNLKDFMEARDPVALLGEMNKIVVDGWDPEDEVLQKGIKLAKVEYPGLLDSCQDLKVLGRKELRDLLRWRKEVLKAEEKPKETKEKESEKELDLDTVEKEALKRLKKERRKALERKAKQLANLQNKGAKYVDLTEEQIASFAALSESEDESLSGSSFSEKQEEEEELNSEDELVRMEAEIDQLCATKERKPSQKDDDLEDSGEEKEVFSASEEEGEEVAANVTENPQSALWFSQPIFQKINESVAQKNKKPKKQKQEDEDDGKIVFVPREEIDEHDKEVLMTGEGIDAALKLVNNRKRGKADLIDDSFNRYTFGEKGNDLPAWFAADESKHNKPQKPISKEAVQILKDKIRQLDKAPIKKVLEARGRKKRRAERRLEALKKQAGNLVTSTEEHGPDTKKVEKLQTLMKKAGNERRRKKVVVAKGNLKGTKGRPRGVKGRYKMVDSRMRKDERNQKIASKKKGGPKRKNGGSTVSKQRK